jgi:hypothetical protein
MAPVACQTLARRELSTDSQGRSIALFIRRTRFASYIYRERELPGAMEAIWASRGKLLPTRTASLGSPVARPMLIPIATIIPQVCHLAHAYLYVAMNERRGVGGLSRWYISPAGR